jgi:integrase
MFTLQTHMETYLTGRARRAEIGLSRQRGTRYAIQGFVQSYGARPPSQLGQAAVLRWLETIGHLAVATRRFHHSALRGWFKFLHDEYGLPDLRPYLPAQKVPRQRPRPLSRTEIVRLLTSLPDARARAVVALELYTALRSVEVSRLNVEDYDGVKVYVTGKGGHQREIEVGRQCAAALDAWLAERGAASGPMFPGDDGPLTPQTLSEYVVGWMKECGVKQGARDGRSAHALRRTGLTHMYEETHDIVLVKDVAGHAFVSTTMIYVGPTHQREAMLRAVERNYFEASG